MAIPSVNINPQTSSPVSSTGNQIFSNAPAPVVDKTRSSLDTPPSTIVTLSAEAQKLSQSNTNQNQNKAVAAENTPSVPKEANEASGIQFMEGQTRGGRISTYA